VQRIEPGLVVECVPRHSVPRDHREDPDIEAVVEHAHETDSSSMTQLEGLEPYPDPTADDRWIFDESVVHGVLDQLMQDGLLVRESPFQLRWTGDEPFRPLIEDETATNHSKNREILL
jgi:hypothetical protein